MKKQETKKEEKRSEEKMLQLIRTLVEENHLASESGVVELTEPFQAEINGAQETVEGFNIESGDLYLNRPCDLWFGINVETGIIEKLLEALIKQIEK